MEKNSETNTKGRSNSLSLEVVGVTGGKSFELTNVGGLSNWVLRPTPLNIFCYLTNLRIPVIESKTIHVSLSRYQQNAVQWWCDMYLSFDDDFGLLYLSREELLILSREVDFLLFLSCDEELSLNLSGDAFFCLYFSSGADLLLYWS